METAATGIFRPAKFAERHQHEGWTEPQIRWLIFNAQDNGLAEAGAIIRQGRRVFIDESRFYAWLRSRKVPA